MSESITLTFKKPWATRAIIRMGGNCECCGQAVKINSITMIPGSPPRRVVDTTADPEGTDTFYQED